MNTKPIRRRAKQRRGVVATEFAITLPVLLLFFFAAFEVARFSMLIHTVENAAYEGARTGIIPGASATNVEAEAARILGTLGVRNATITITPSTIEDDTESVTVDIRVPFGPNSFAPSILFGDAVVQRDLTMIREGS